MGELIMFPTRSTERAPTPAAPATALPTRTAPTAVAPASVATTGAATTSTQPIPRSADDFPSPARTLLWREAVGHQLRSERTAQDRTQSDVAERAGISTQYLSEVERGRKEPSSEILEAVGSALGLTLLDLTTRVSRTLRATAGPVLLAA